MSDKVDVAWATSRDLSIMLDVAADALKEKVRETEVRLMLWKNNVEELPFAYDAETGNPLHSRINPLQVLTEYKRAYKLARQLSAKLSRSGIEADAAALAEMFKRR